ncbi:hypothetical protein DENSPDRAFT_883777 [Dentipellis sp. KUC8613]|nr:hypothetical protein DENSPDRAFT_883777 [Dentipellis sp. KUC8613]
MDSFSILDTIFSNSTPAENQPPVDAEGSGSGGESYCVVASIPSFTTRSCLSCPQAALLQKEI